MRKITVIAKKTLFDQGGRESFTKDKEYQSLYSQWTFTEETILLNNQGISHSPGNWINHFKLKK